MTSIVKDRNTPKQRHAWNCAWVMSPIARLATLSITGLFALLLFGTAAVGDAGEAAQQETTPGAADPTDAADSADDASDDAALPFDLAEVGLAGLPAPLRTTEDFALALRLIDERIAALRAAVEPVPESPPTDQTPGEAGDMDTQASAADAGNRGVDTEAASAEPDRSADTEAAGDDPRIASLEGLRYRIERRAGIAEQVETANKSAALEQEQLARIESDVSAEAEPISITRLDALKAERALAQAKEKRATRRLASARAQLEARERVLREAQRVRRDARDAVARSNEEEQPSLMLALEVARLELLLAIQARDAAAGQLALARAEGEVAALEQARLTAEIERVGDTAVLTETDLAERLKLLDERMDGLNSEIASLRRRGDSTGSRLSRARRRLQQAETDADRRLLAERVAALDAQVEAAGAAIDYLQRAITNLRGMGTLWQRRRALMVAPGGNESGDESDAQVGAWYEAVRATLSEHDNAIDELETELSAIRGAQLNLARRLAEPDLEPVIRDRLRDREQAAAEVEQAARRLLETHKESAALAQRVQEQLEPLLRERSLSIRWQQTQDRLLGWWQADLLVVDDQSVRVREGVIALVVFCAVVAGIWIFKLLLRRGLARRQPRAQAEQQGGIRLLLSAVSRHTTQLFILVLAFYVAMEVSGLAGAKLESWLWTLLVLALYLQIGLWVNAAVVDYFTRRRSRLQQQDPSAATGYGLLLFFLRVGVWIVVIVSALAYFNYPIAGLIGALGVGGIAVGLAVQNILGDVFSSMAIVLDKPVRVGDFIKAGETLGTVEHIGVKTTRIRSLSGEQIVLSNTDLLNSRVHNFKRFEERRSVFQIGVIYQTPRNDLERIADMLKAAVEEQEQTRFDRAHFTEFGAFSLDFEVVYFVLSPDFALYRDIQQAINFSIHRRFEEAGIEFAYPTQELILRRGSSLAR
jgi:MscS family membrane protein